MGDEMLGTARDTKVHEGKSERQVANQSAGGALSWKVTDGVIELALHRAPCNELGSASLDELEKFATALEGMQAQAHAHALIIHSKLKPGFCAGGDPPDWRKRFAVAKRFMGSFDDFGVGKSTPICQES